MKKIYFWLIRIIPAFILLQTLYFKFTGHPESVVLFSTLGVEPYGRIITGIIELVTSILLLTPANSFYGAIIGFGTMLGAILSHIFIIGIEFNNDSGSLFTLAVVTFICCSLILYSDRNKLSIFKTPNL